MALWDHLPEDVKAEILYKLPVKSLLQCTAVCKSLNSLIKSPNFITTHLRKSPFSNTNDPQLFLVRFASECHGLFGIQYSLCSDKKQLDDMNVHIHPFFDRTQRFTLITGSCNGLLCLFNNTSYKIMLWNPSIRKTLTISKLNFNRGPDSSREFYDFVGMGFDSNTNDFKVLRMMTEIETGNWVKADIYSLKSDSLKDITHITQKHCYFTDLGVPVFVNNALHWIGCDRENDSLHIMVFDVTDEVFREIMLPERLVNNCVFQLSIIAYGESSIAVTRKNYHADLWVMKEYGVVESWVKFKSVGSCLEGNGRSIVLGIRNNAEAIVEYYNKYAWSVGKLISYDLETKQIKNLIDEMEEGNSFVYNYMESLALIDKGN